MTSFHGGHLATEAPDSPHLLMSDMKAEVYIAAADGDALYPPEMAARLESALDAANVRYVSEIYAGAAHGWMKPDFPVFDREAAEVGWSKLLTFLKRTLAPSD